MNNDISTPPANQPGTSLDEVVELARQGNYPDAVLRLRELARAGGYRPTVLGVLGRVLRSSVSRADELLPYIQKAVPLSPKSEAVLQGLLQKLAEKAGGTPTTPDDS